MTGIEKTLRSFVHDMAEMTNNCRPDADEGDMALLDVFSEELTKEKLKHLEQEYIAEKEVREVESPRKFTGKCSVKVFPDIKELLKYSENRRRVLGTVV